MYEYSSMPNIVATVACQNIKLSVGINATLECHGHIIYHMNGNKRKPTYTHTHVITWISEITFADIISWHFTGHFQLILKEYAYTCKYIGIFFVCIPTHFIYSSKNFYRILASIAIQ